MNETLLERAGSRTKLGPAREKALRQLLEAEDRYADALLAQSSAIIGLLKAPGTQLAMIRMQRATRQVDASGAAFDLAREDYERTK